MENSKLDRPRKFTRWDTMLILRAIYDRKDEWDRPDMFESIQVECFWEKFSVHQVASRFQTILRNHSIYAYLKYLSSKKRTWFLTFYLHKRNHQRTAPLRDGEMHRRKERKIVRVPWTKAEDNALLLEDKLRKSHEWTAVKLRSFQALECRTTGDIRQRSMTEKVPGRFARRKPQIVHHHRKNGKVKFRTFWNEDETKELKKLHKHFTQVYRNASEWTLIRAFAKMIKPHRTTVDIKDKMRILMSARKGSQCVLDYYVENKYSWYPGIDETKHKLPDSSPTLRYSVQHVSRTFVLREKGSRIPRMLKELAPFNKVPSKTKAQIP